MKDKKNLYFVIGLVTITIILCGTMIWINYNSWTLRIESDDNVVKIFESIEWDAMNQDEVWNCQIPMEKGNYIFSNGILISPSGKEILCNELNLDMKSSGEIKE